MSQQQFNQRRFISDCNAALADVAEQHELQSITLSTNRSRSLDAYVVQVEGISQENAQSAITARARAAGVDPELYGAEFSSHGTRYKVVDFKNAPKNNIIIRGLTGQRGGKDYICSENAVRTGLELEQVRGKVRGKDAATAELDSFGH